MRSFKDMEHMFDDAFCRRIDHRFHAQGNELDPEWIAMTKRWEAQLDEVGAKQPWWTMTDQVWVVCLFKAGIIEKDSTVKLLNALDEVGMDSSGDSGEVRLVKLLDGNMDLASVVNYGRTLQEPMSRLKMRDKLIEVFDDLLHILETIHRVAMDNLDTIMPGYTHLNHGQPVTFAHWLLGIFDGLHRGVLQLEQAYAFTNRNTGGCGSCSGITWEVDRNLQTALLGMDATAESTYECEAAQDHSMASLFALSNISILLSQAAMNMNIWAMDEIDMVRTRPSWCGVSSFMPQKCDSGSNYERTRAFASDVMGETMKCMVQLRGEPYADMQAMYQLPDRAMVGFLDARSCIQMFDQMLSNTIVQKDRMLKIARSGYSCTTEVATHLIREHGYGGRLAHSIVATMTRQARCEGLKSYECTGKMLDEAADYLDVRKPGLDDETLRRLLNPEEFIKTHTNLGGVAPEENQRLFENRLGSIAEVRERQAARRMQVNKAADRLKAEIADICGNGTKQQVDAVEKYLEK